MTFVFSAMRKYIPSKGHVALKLKVKFFDIFCFIQGTFGEINNVEGEASYYI